MKTEPIRAAQIDWSTGTPRASTFDDVYHARDGALEQAEHVFVRGNGLPERWQGRQRFVILENGFGLGHNFLATWARWRADAARCRRLHVVSIDRHPPSKTDLERAHATSPLRDAARALVRAWPPLTGDLHRLSFDDGAVELLLAFGEAEAWLRRLVLQADAIYLDGFDPARNPAMWSEAVFAALPRLAAPGCTAATWSVARAVRDGLAAHGFEVGRAPGFAAKREMTVARFAPRHRPRPDARSEAVCAEARSAVVVGAGLAGAATAHALADAGLDVTVLDAAGEPASGASGNAGGLFRAIVARDDGAHARWHRVSALDAARRIAPLVESGLVRGACDGVLHLGDDLEALRQLAQRQALPADFVHAVDAAEASRLAGIELRLPAWHFVSGGWVAPAELVRHWLDEARARFVGHCTVAGLGWTGSSWVAVDADGAARAEGDIVVLANAHDAARFAPQARWRLSRSRGQVTRVPRGTAGLLAPRLPLARNGYALTLTSGDVLCGATQVGGDDEAALRADDHAHNLAVLARLTGRSPQVPEGLDGFLAGRVGWRCHTDDRLPLVGAAPRAPSGGGAGDGSDRRARAPQPRHVPREPGLFVLTALGSRGIPGAGLAGRLLAGLVTGSPLPLDADLVDALDAARHVARAARAARS